MSNSNKTTRDIFLDCFISGDTMNVAQSPSTTNDVIQAVYSEDQSAIKINLSNMDLSGMTATTPGAPDTSIQYNDGGIFAGATIYTYDKTNQSLNLGTNTVTGLYSAGFGFSNTVAGNQSVAYGQYCTASGIGSFANGRYCKSTANFTFSTGQFAEANGTNSAAFGGGTKSNGVYAFAGGEGGTGIEVTADGRGSFNFSHNTIVTSGAVGDYSAILGGLQNSASGLHSGVFCGKENTVTGEDSVIVGASSSVVSGPFNGVFAGEEGECNGSQHSVILGGLQNTTVGYCNLIGASEGSVASQDFATVIASQGSTNDGEYSAIIAGDDCTAEAYLNLISNSQSCTATEDFGTIIGSANCTNNGEASIILGCDGLTVNNSNTTYVANFEIDTQSESSFIMKDAYSGARYNIILSGGTLTPVAI